MRFHIDQCVRAMSGFQGQFSQEMEAFWRNVETLYKNCNVLQIPQEHLPLWWMRAVDDQVPLEATEKRGGLEPSGVERRGPGRPRKELVGA